MIFYEGILDLVKSDDENFKFNQAKLARASERFNRMNPDAFIGCCEYSTAEQKLHICMMQTGDVGMEKKLSEYASLLPYKIKSKKFHEITSTTFSDMVGTGFKKNLLPSEGQVAMQYRVALISDTKLGYGEHILTKQKKAAVEEMLSECDYQVSLKEELKRIYAPNKCKTISGHPVHYQIFAGNFNESIDAREVLLNALYAKKRVKCGRILIIDAASDCKRWRMEFNKAYDSSKDSTIIVDCTELFSKPALPLIQKDVETPGDEMDRIQYLSALAESYSDDVQTVMILPEDCEKVCDRIAEYSPNVTWVEIAEDKLSPAEARKELRLLAKDKNLVADRTLTSWTSGLTEIRREEIRGHFEEWKSKQIKKQQFPQYCGVKTRTSLSVQTKAAKKAAPKDPYEELMDMVGLDDIKAQVKQIVAYHRYYAMKPNKDGVNGDMSYHMILSGAPGTGKTTAARLIAKIFAKEGILSKGQMVEVGKQDLTGRYLGESESLVKEKIKEAIGGVLFIDEAYSLNLDRDIYAKSIINTLVQEVENHRDEMVCILAGYSDEMKEFLETNPGLKSRFKYHLNAKDFTTDQLLEIARKTAKEKGLTISPKGQEKLKEAFILAEKDKNFGNGRYVRNAIEKAQVAHISRMMEKYENQPDPKKMTVLGAEDFALEEETDHKAVPLKAIGFSA